MEMAWFREHRTLVRVLAVVVPLLVSATLYLIPGLAAGSAAALVLMVLVVAASATGDRVAGLLAAVCAALGFDFFLTQPYLTLRIDNAEDLEVAVLLLLVGLAVNELALWGIRQSAAAAGQAVLVRGALESADLAASSTSDADGLERVADSIRSVLGVEQVGFVYGDHDAMAGVIQRDGSLRFQGRTLEVALTGLPRHHGAYAVIPVARNGAQVGYFRIDTAGRDVRPSLEQLRVAVLLAGQWALRTQPDTRPVRHQRGATAAAVDL